MLYPLSYGGARAQSSDLRGQPGRQGPPLVHSLHPRPVLPAQARPGAREPGFAYGGRRVTEPTPAHPAASARGPHAARH